ncbi:hypothetical protein RH831_10640 [Halodesulfurarchaeum sp. HSR-GB]|uniref:hypothetical protein n=1 Tax=Halodesulfurarchaeum sp. HSR-GB TaxID=3074077 RepID=UPI00285F1B7F|nr:hypothetical protein [Halodesulfurarchaeum sp. HSR-GB]MDR5657634.1 hypothetical protein [Halodesulfurarchaeum sp. HSR-GB]
MTGSKLTRSQKSALLERAKTVARLCFEQFEDWGMEASIQGGIDDTADERATNADFEGPRWAAYEFLNTKREEIAWELFDKPRVRR